MEQQVRLQRAQTAERAYLAAAFKRVGDLELRRAAGAQRALTRFARVYSGAAEVGGAAAGLLDLLGQIDAEADLEAFSQTAASSVRRCAGGGAGSWPPAAACGGVSLHAALVCRPPCRLQVRDRNA